MKQVEHGYPSFGFFGPSPIDFDTRIEFGQCVWNDICGFDVAAQLEKGISKFGFIFNTDPHNKGGEHWIAMYVDANIGEITYMDSYGDPPPVQISRLIARLEKQLRSLGVEPIVNVINRRHQLGDSECGMYCLFFIVSLVRGDRKPVDFQKQRIADNEVRKLREVYFNKTV